MPYHRRSHQDQGMVALPSGEIIRRNSTESFAAAFYRIKQDMLRSKSNFISTDDIHYHRGSAYYIIPGWDRHKLVDIDKDEDNYYDNALSDYYKYDNEDYDLSEYEDERRELDEAQIFAAEHQQKDTKSFCHQVMDSIYILSRKCPGNDFQTSDIKPGHDKARYSLRSKDELQKENAPLSREFQVGLTNDPPIQQANRTILRWGEWPLEPENETVTRKKMRKDNIPLNVPAEAWPRQPCTYPTTSATPQSREQGAWSSQDMEMRVEMRKGCPTALYGSTLLQAQLRCSTSLQPTIIPLCLILWWLWHAYGLLWKQHVAVLQHLDVPSFKGLPVSHARTSRWLFAGIRTGWWHGTCPTRGQHLSIPMRILQQWFRVICTFPKYVEKTQTRKDWSPKRHLRVRSWNMRQLRSSKRCWHIDAGSFYPGGYHPSSSSGSAGWKAKMFSKHGGRSSHPTSSFGSSVLAWSSSLQFSGLSFVPQSTSSVPWNSWHILIWTHLTMATPQSVARCSMSHKSRQRTSKLSLSSPRRRSCSMGM